MSGHCYWKRFPSRLCRGTILVPGSEIRMARWSGNGVVHASRKFLYLYPYFQEERIRNFLISLRKQNDNLSSSSNYLFLILIIAGDYSCIDVNTYSSDQKRRGVYHIQALESIRFSVNLLSTMRQKNYCNYIFHRKKEMKN